MCVELRAGARERSLEDVGKYGREVKGGRRVRCCWPERSSPCVPRHTLHPTLMERQPHDTDLSEAEWARIRPLLPGPCPYGRPIEAPRRAMVNAILYGRRADCAWRWRRVEGRKRHLVVDTLGLPPRVAVLAADIQDRDGAREVLDGLQDDFPRLRVIWGAAATRSPN